MGAFWINAPFPVPAEGSRLGVLWLLGSSPEVSGSFPRGEEPGAALSAQSHAGCEEPRLSRGVQQLQMRALIEKTPAVTENDSAGVTAGVCPWGMCCQLCGGSRGCTPHQDPPHNPREAPPCPGSGPARGITGAGNVLIPLWDDFPALYLQQVLKCLQNE